MRHTTLQTPMSVKKEGEDVLQSPAVHGEDCGEAAAPLQPMQVLSGAEILLHLEEDPM